MVETNLIKPTYIEKTINLIGTIRPQNTTLLTAKASGLLKSRFSAGQKVKKGELIALIINPEIEKNYQLSKDVVEISETQFNRFRQLKNKGFVSKRELDEKKQQLIEAQKEVAKTKIELENLRFNAPFDGVISAFKIRDGMQVKDGDPVVTVYDPLNLVVDIDIPCHYLHNIKENQTIYINSEKYNLSHLQRMMDNETHMCPADVNITCNHCIIGDTIDVKLQVKENERALVIPSQATFLRDGRLSIYKVVNNHIKLVHVKPGIREKNNVEIISGLQSADQVIIKNTDRLYPGMEVSIFQPRN